jgi:hypothetical protein
MDNNSDVDVWRLWQEQAREEQVMPLDDIRSKAERLDTRTRRSRVATAVVVILLVMWEAWQVWIQEETLERAGDLLTIAAFVYVAYRFRTHRLAAPPVALGRTNTVEFCRAELIRQRDLSKDSWGYLLPFVPGVTLSLFGGGFENRPASHVIALVGFGVALFVGIAWWNVHTVRKLHREIEALDAL